MNAAPLSPIAVFGQGALGCPGMSTTAETSGPAPLIGQRPGHGVWWAEGKEDSAHR